MASSSVSVQSFLATPTSSFGRTNTRNAALPSLHFLRQQRNSRMQIRCMAEDQKPEEPVPVAIPTPSPKVSRKLSDVMAFSGPAPERINGRLAMIGFVSAIAAELALGDDVAVQLANGGLNWFVGSVVVLSLASLAPLIKGVSVESKSKGFMTSDAEMWNGRFAMLGLVALVFTEFVKGGALV
ncbi:Early light-induced protein 1 [Ranunculus cassubicifolius]